MGRRARIVAGIIRGIIRWSRRLANLIFIMLAVSIASIVHGVPGAAKQIGNDWAERVVGWGIPSQTVDPMKPWFRRAAYVVMAIYWVVIAELTVLVLRWLF